MRITGCPTVCRGVDGFHNRIRMSRAIIPTARGVLKKPSKGSGSCVRDRLLRRKELRLATTSHCSLAMQRHSCRCEERLRRVPHGLRWDRWISRLNSYSANHHSHSKLWGTQFAVEGIDFTTESVWREPSFPQQAVGHPDCLNYRRISGWGGRVIRSRRTWPAGRPSKRTVETARAIGMST